MENKPQNIDEYIALFDADVQQKLNSIRQTCKQSLPNAIEKISYGMPTFHQKKNIGHFAAYKNHIGFYPGPKAIEVFKSDLKDYKTSKGAIQFPLNKEIPLDLVKKILEFNVENI